MIPKRTVTELSATITGAASNVPLLQPNGREFGSPGVEAGGFIELLTATSATLSIRDSRNRLLYSNSITASTSVPAAASGVTGPLTVTVSAISNSAHSLKVTWWVKK